jgi:hypothetical protein
MQKWVLRLATGVALAGLVACAAPGLGHRFAMNPNDLKVGHDEKEDVLRKMGQPYRRFVDSKGREVFVYVWADGQGNGEKCIIAFNEDDAVYLVEVSP